MEPKVGPRPSVRCEEGLVPPFSQFRCSPCCTTDTLDPVYSNVTAGQSMWFQLPDGLHPDRDEFCPGDEPLTKADGVHERGMAETNCVGSQDAARKPHGLTWAALLLSERDDVDLDVLHLGHFMPEISPCMAPE
eukprot:s2032_g9.t5